MTAVKCNFTKSTVERAVVVLSVPSTVFCAAFYAGRLLSARSCLVDVQIIGYWRAKVQLVQYMWCSSSFIRACARGNSPIQGCSRECLLPARLRKEKAVLERKTVSRLFQKFLWSLFFSYGNHPEQHPAQLYDIRPTAMVSNRSLLCCYKNKVVLVCVALRWLLVVT